MFLQGVLYFFRVDADVPLRDRWRAVLEQLLHGHNIGRLIRTSSVYGVIGCIGIICGL